MAGLTSFIHGFSQRLKQLNLAQLPIEDYPRKYLFHLLDQQQYYLHIYSHVLQQVISHCNKPKEEIILVDYGCGNGLLGLFAKHCGFKKVYLADVSNPFMQAAKHLTAVLNMDMAGFITGDVTDLSQNFLKQQIPDAIAGTDVIEHIYDLTEFFSTIATINPNMVTVFTTASVNDNRYKSKQLEHLQYSDEHESSDAGHAPPGHPYAGLSFLEMRKKIIQKHEPTLPAEEMAKCAVATRGMKSDDIVRALTNYIATGELPKTPSHPTNTCDPITGSWTERLLQTSEYQNIYKEAGFELEVNNGFYNQWQGGIKSLVLTAANTALQLSGKSVRFIAPFITLVGNTFDEKVR